MAVFELQLDHRALNFLSRLIVLTNFIFESNMVVADTQISSSGALELSAGESYGFMTLLDGLLINPRWSPYFDIEYQHGDVFVSTRTGVGYKLVNCSQINAGVSMNYQPGRSESSDRRYQGMGNVAAEPAPSLFVEWKPFGGIVDIFAEAGQSIGHNPSLYGTLELTTGFPISKNVDAFIDLLSTAGDTRYLQTFYGVSPSQAESSHYPVYRPAASITNITATTGFIYNISAAWRLTADAGWQRYCDNAAESPLVSHSIRSTANIFFTHSF